MKPVPCPTCGAETRVARMMTGGKPYCSRCGWNAAIVQGPLRLEIKTMLGVFLFIAVVGVLRTGISLHNWRGAEFLIASFAAICGGLALISYVNLTKVQKFARRAAPGPEADAPPMQHGVSGTEAGRKHYRALLDLALPRAMRLTRRAKVNILFYILFAIAYIYAATVYFEGVHASASAASGQRFALLLFGACLFLSTVFFIRRWVREERLMQTGAASVGVVKRQHSHQFVDLLAILHGHIKTSDIHYVFPDAAGKSHFGQGRDASFSLFEDMPVLVLFDRDDPSENVALYCSLFELHGHTAEDRLAEPAAKPKDAVS